MNFKLELPEGTILVNKDELKKVLQEVLMEINRSSTNEEIMTIREAADFLKVSVPTVRKLIAEKDIPYFQKGQVIRLSSKHISEWLNINSKRGIS